MWVAYILFWRVRPEQQPTVKGKHVINYIKAQSTIINLWEKSQNNSRKKSGIYKNEAVFFRESVEHFSSERLW